MTTFCLIHGSAQSGRAWQLLVKELSATGHTVFLPDLPTNEPDAGAIRCAEVVAEKMLAAGDAVVVAHSATGLILPVVASQVPTTLMVFLAAAIPVPGMTFLEQLAPDPTVMFFPVMDRAEPGPG